MSLHHAAQHLAAQGRNGDSMLVHMTPNEVSGLQTLLQSKGRHLTINPHTGLPEAWLGNDIVNAGSDLIGGIGDAVKDATSSPIGSMLVGAALVAAGVPPQFAGLATGAASYATGNSFKQSVGAGLAGQGGGSFAGSQGWEGALNPSNSVPATSPGGAVPAAVPGAPVSAPVASPTPVTAGPVEPLAPAAPTATATPAMSDRQFMNSSIGFTGTPDFGTAQFEPRPGITPENYGAGYTGPTSASLGAEQTFADKAGDFVANNYGKIGLGALALGALGEKQKTVDPTGTNYEGAYIRPYVYDPETRGLRQLTPVKAPVKAATGGMLAGGPVERMSNANSVGANTGYPTADINQGAYATPWQTPISRNVVADSSDSGVDSFTGEPRGMAAGGISDLGSYSDGGRLLRGPGDGVSDSIPAQIGGKQPARLADGEFVVPARIVSELGNGSTDAGARQLYKMMDRIQAARGKTVGKNKVAANSNAAKHLPA